MQKQRNLKKNTIMKIALVSAFSTLEGSRRKCIHRPKCLVLFQLPGQLHGGRQRWSHVRLPA